MSSSRVYKCFYFLRNMGCDIQGNDHEKVIWLKHKLCHLAFQQYYNDPQADLSPVSHKKLHLENLAKRAALEKDKERKMQAHNNALEAGRVAAADSSREALTFFKETEPTPEGNHNKCKHLQLAQISQEDMNNLVLHSPELKQKFELAVVNSLTWT